MNKINLLNKFLSYLNSEYEMNVSLKVTGPYSYYDPSNNLIFLGMDTIIGPASKSLWTLAHEFQHAIQNKNNDARMVFSKAEFKRQVRKNALFSLGYLSLGVLFYHFSINSTYFVFFTLTTLSLLNPFKSRKLREAMIELEIEADGFANKLVGGHEKFFSSRDFYPSFMREHPLNTDRKDAARIHPLNTELLNRVLELTKGTLS